MSGLQIDVAGALDGRAGAGGIPADHLRDGAARLALVRDRPAWRDLAAEPMRSEHVRAVTSLAERWRPTTDNLVVLGIGGSALGNIALQQALNDLTWNLHPDDRRGGPRLFVLDNVDPDLVGPVLDEVRRSDPTLERTLVNVISKSGETAETAAQFLLVRAWLAETLGDRHADRIIAVTDPSSGTMRAICDREGYATLAVPDGVGGRFSVLSPVGLFSAAMCGIDIDALLDGAAAMDERCSAIDPEDNPAALLAALLMLHTESDRCNHVLMPYSNRLLGLAGWYRQLWAESLGKRYDAGGAEVFAGPTPISGLGATDQHSQLQLYLEGPDDKVIGFLEVDAFDRDRQIPSGFDCEPLAYLQGRSLGELLNVEKRATEYALAESQRPTYTIRFPRIDANTVGAFIQLWCVATMMAGVWLNVNPFDQPAVETGKQATFGLMGRAGFEDWRRRVYERIGE